MEKQLKVLMIGAHPDDNDFDGGGTALKYVKAGHKVRFLSVCNGCGGHQSMEPKDIAERRYGETREVAKVSGIEYDVWDIPDCEVMADLETRKRMVRYIREYSPDIIFTHRTNDYHADHRNVAMLVQDASYLLIVPNFCPEVSAMAETPVIMYFYDGFRNPPFEPVIAVDIADVVDDKFKIYNCHVSQVYEWLPFTYGTLDTVPEGEEERKKWLREPLVPRDRLLSVEELSVPTNSRHGEYSLALKAAICRDTVVARYGDKAKNIIFAEIFGISEYGKKLTDENRDVLFPF